MLKYFFTTLVIAAAVVVLLRLQVGRRIDNYLPSNTSDEVVSPSVPAVSGGIALGVYQPAANPFVYGKVIDEKYTRQVGKKPAFAWFSVKWQNPNTGAYTQFDPRILEQFRTRGIMPGLTWDASKGPALNKEQPDFAWKSITSGKHDAYIAQVAKASAEYGHPFILRTLHEMNGNWYPWGYSVNGNDSPDDYVAAWKHIVALFRQEGATNVQFAWVPAGGIMTPDRLKEHGDIFKAMYPGDEYVDWVGLDGYADLSAGDARSLEQVFKPSYDFLLPLTTRPFILFEVGATEDPRDSTARANWITEGFLTTLPNEFSRVKIVNWFNSANDSTVNKKDYSLTSSQDALNAWKEVVESPLYEGSLLK